MTYLALLGIVVFAFILIRGTDLMIVSIKRIGKKIGGRGTYAVTAIILAAGTSFPELFIGITSAVENNPNLALGIIIGSNIVNMSLVVGVATVVAGKVAIFGDILKRDVALTLFASTLPILLVFDGILSRIDGLILFVIYAAYASSFFKESNKEVAKAQGDANLYKFIRNLNIIDQKNGRDWGYLFGGIAIVLFSADVMVKLATFLADAINIPRFVVGLIILSVGTSLPELVFSIKSIKNHNPSIVIGNLLGTTVANSALILGIVALIMPIRVAIEDFYIASAFFVAIFLVFWYFIKSKHRLDRWEAGLLIVLYISFLIVEIF